MTDPMLEQLMRRIQGDRQAFEDSRQIFLAMLDRDLMKKLKESGGIPQSLDELEEFLVSQGYYFRQVSLTGEWWATCTGTLLAFMADTDAPVILKPHFASYYYVHPVSRKKVHVNNAAAALTLKPAAFTLTPPMPRHQLKLKDVLKYGAKSLCSFDYIYILITCIGFVLLQMMSPYVNKLLFSEVIPSGDSSQIVPIMVLLVSTAIGLAALKLARSLVAFRIKDKVEYSVQTALMGRMLHLHPAFFKEYQPGDLSNRVLSLSRFSSLITESIISVVLTFLFTGFLFIQFFLYGGPLLLSGIAVLTLMLLSTILHYHYTRMVQSTVNPANSRLFGVLHSLFSGSQKIKTSGAEYRAFRIWAKAYEPTEPFSSLYPRISVVSGAIAYCVRLLPMLVTMFAAFKCNLGLSDYIAYCAVLSIAVGAMEDFFHISATVGRIIPECRLCNPILEAVPEEDENLSLVKEISGAVDIRGLKFRYNSETPYIFDGLDLHVNPGDYLALVGPSGCGKSTLVRLMMGFEKAESGSIFYDMYDLESMNKQSFRQFCVSICLQHGQMLEGTILDNILFNASWLTEEDAWEAARMVALDEDIRRMPDGMNTRISLEGEGVSGGQRQRILLARAIIRKPSIIFLDEATSALDNISQHIVSENLAKMGCTRIVIAHRTSTLRACNRIIVLAGGKVADEGTYDELMSREGYFSEINRRQSL